VRVLGVDPGTLHTGYGIIETRGDELLHLASGVIHLKGELPDRLLQISRTLEELIALHRPEMAAVEDLFHYRNARSALKLGHARGVALLAAARAGLPIHSYAPAQVKHALVGHGRAQKHQIQYIIRILMGLKEEPPTDAADALAVAVCHTRLGKARSLEDSS